MLKKIFLGKFITALTFLVGLTFFAGDANAAVPVISFSADSIVIPVNSSANLSWDVSDAVSCEASGSWSGVQSLSGVYNTGNIVSDQTYVLICTGSEGESVSASVSVTVADPPELTFVAENQTIEYNTATNLIWSSTGADSCLASDAWSGSLGLSGSQSTGNLISEKTYTLSCEGQGGTVTKSITVSISSPTSVPELNFSADRYFIDYDDSVVLAWSSSSANICLASGDWSGDKGLSGTQGSGNLQSDKNYILTCTGEGGSITQYVGIVVAPEPTTPPDLTFTAVDYDIGYAEETTLNWASTNADSCSAYGTFGFEQPTSGSYNTGTLYSSKTYTLGCEGSGGTVIQTVTINVGPNPFPPPSLTFSADEAVISYDSSTNLNWTSTDASSCSASGDWTGTKSLSGTESTGNLTEDQVYQLSCVGPGGTVSDSVVVAVDDPTVPPSVNFWADDYNVVYNTGTILRWTSDDADWCSLSYDVSAQGVSLDGNYSTGNLTEDSYYSLACGNAAGTTIEAVNISVSVTGPAPTVNLWADDNPVDYGSSTTVRWDTENADSCQIAGEGSVPIDGSLDTGSMYSPRTFLLTCIGPGGDAQDSLTINITEGTVPANPPDLSFWADNYLLLEGENTNLHWTSTNADWCQASLGWNGSKSLSGDQNTGALYATTSYRLTCGNIQGEVSSTLTVEIGNLPDVDLDFWADEYQVPEDGSTNLHWDSTNANFCMTYGGNWGWFDYKDFDGSEAIGPLTNYSNYYGLYCRNFLSSVVQSVTVLAGDPPPTVSFYADATTIAYNTPATLHWDSTNATYCQAWSDNPEELTWQNEKEISGAHTTMNLRSNTRFYIRCFGSGGYSTRSVYVRVASPANPVPSISFYADNYAVSIGGDTQVHWLAENASGCQASSDSEINWSGGKAVSGDQSVGPFSESANLTLTCWNSYGSSSAALSIAAGTDTVLRPTMSFWADAYSIASGDSTILRWSAVNADSCVASGDWSGDKSTGTGSENTGSLDSPRHYELKCSNAGGEISSFVDINVGGPAPAPTLSFIADDYDVEAGDQVTLSWVSTNATDCFASGGFTSGWSGNQSLNGDKVVMPSYSNTYELTCNGPGGSITANVPIAVSKVIVCPANSQLNVGQTRQLAAWYKQTADVLFSCSNLSGAVNVTNGYDGFGTDWTTDNSSIVSLPGTPGLVLAENYSAAAIPICAEYKEIRGCAGVSVVLTCWECQPGPMCSPVGIPAGTCGSPYYSDSPTCLRACSLEWGSWREVSP